MRAAIAFALLLFGCTERASTKDASGPSIPPPRDAGSFAVIELFTSEGCSSCPPADDLLREIDDDARANARPVFVLAYHVDYWDDLGWRDRFGSKRWTDRQRGYSTGDGAYTPQAMIDGTIDVLGSDRASIARLVADELGRGRDAVIHASASEAAGKATIEFSIDGPTSNAVVRAALVERGLSSDVGAGENAGKTIHHAPVVRALETVAAAPKGSIAIATNGVDRANARLIVFLQSRGSPASIDAATAIDLP